MKRVVVGMSGGVDSSVAAYLCQQQGYEVIGLFMKNWHDDSVTISDECPWLDDSNDAMVVADKLGIPFQTVDLSEEYRTRIVDYMFKEYENGRTPNPDVLCNREIKFDVFLKIAEGLGADYIATGHYCQKDSFEKNGKTYYRLLAGHDNNKDQSYFLCQINQQQLSKIMFPIGHLDKSEVREIAKQQDLITADKKDSQGLCFIGKVKLPKFLQQQLKPKQGDVIEIPTDSFHYNSLESEHIEALTKKINYKADEGIYKGKHQGAHYFTKGQRKGLNIGGTPEPLFVIDTNVQENIIYVGQGKHHPGLYRKGLEIKNHEVHWLREDLKLEVGENAQYLARIRYRQPLENVTLYQTENELIAIFENQQMAIAEGQFMAWYKDDELIGSGVIS